MNTPLIKWTGSKRPIAAKITSYFPKEIETYYEPFVGGGSVFFQLLKDNANVKKFKLSDKNDSLINILTTVKDKPQELILLRIVGVLWRITTQNITKTATKC